MLKIRIVLLILLTLSSHVRFGYAANPNCEKGDVILTYLLSGPWLKNLGHTAIYSHWTFSDKYNHWVIQASGFGTVVGYRRFDEILEWDDANFLGAWTPKGTLAAQYRRIIISNAKNQFGCKYGLMWPWIKNPASPPGAGNGSFRCDGLVEYCYEQRDLDFGKGAGKGFFNDDEEMQSNPLDLPFIFFPSAFPERMSPAEGESPSVKITSPSDKETIKGNVNIQAFVDDTIYGSGIDCVIFYYGNNNQIGIAPSTFEISGVAKCNWDTTKVPDGTYQLYANGHPRYIVTPLGWRTSKFYFE